MIRRAGVLAAVLLAAARLAAAQPMAPPPEGAVPSDRIPPGLRDVGIDQRLDARIPLDLPFLDESGHTVRLGDYFAGKPVLLALAYFNCPMLCTQVLNGLASAVPVVGLRPGRDFSVVVVSFDPRDKPRDSAAKRNAYLAAEERRGDAAGWHFLTGEPPAIAALTKAVGFRYRFDRDLGQFAHASAAYVVTPDGRLARYFYGIEYAPRDLRLALVEASSGKIGGVVDAVLLFCFHYDPKSGKYSATIVNVVRLAGIATVLALAVGIPLLARRHRQRWPVLRGAPR